jgi:hypothetical protein
MLQQQFCRFKPPHFNAVSDSSSRRRIVRILTSSPLALPVKPSHTHNKESLPSRLSYGGCVSDRFNGNLFHMYPKTLVVLRNERSTYEIHIEGGNPPQRFIGGQHLDRERLAVELAQHGFPQVIIDKALQEIDSSGSTKLST